MNSIKKPILSKNFSDRLTSLKNELDNWRNQPSKSKRIPQSIRIKVAKLRADGVGISQLQKLGISHQQVKNWLNEAKLTVPVQPITFATVKPQTSQPDVNRYNRSKLPPISEQETAFSFSIKKDDLTIELSCPHIDSATTLLKTIIRDTDVTTNTTS